MERVCNVVGRVNGLSGWLVPALCEPNPVLAGHGPTLLAGLSERIQLELVNRHEFRSGAVAGRYRLTQGTA